MANVRSHHSSSLSRVNIVVLPWIALSLSRSLDRATSTFPKTQMPRRTALPRNHMHMAPHKRGPRFGRMHCSFPSTSRYAFT